MFTKPGLPDSKSWLCQWFQVYFSICITKRKKHYGVAIAIGVKKERKKRIIVSSPLVSSLNLICLQFSFGLRMCNPSDRNRQMIFLMVQIYFHILTSKNILLLLVKISVNLNY